MLIGIIGAMEMEVEGLKAVMDSPVSETISSVTYYRGRINGTECVVACAGVGKVNAAVCAQTMILKYSPACVINTGVAGGLESGQKPGDIVIADSVVEHDMDTTPCGDAPGFINGIDRVYMDCDRELADKLYEAACMTGGGRVSRGIIASGDQFIASAEQRNRIIETFRASAAEMEGASIGHVCCLAGVPFGVIRAVSDGADSSSTVDFPTFAKAAAENSVGILLKLLEIIH